MSKLTQWASKQPVIFLLMLAVLWLVAYNQLPTWSQELVNLLPIEQDTRFHEALSFFFYDVPKILMLLVAITLVMGIVNSYFTPEKTRALLSGKHEGVGNVLAALLGIVTPFCSCSAVSLFVGFLQAGVPLGVTFSFLISAPMVNEIALVLLYGLFGWEIAALYLGMGLLVAIIAGFVIGKLGMEHQLEDWVQALRKVEAGLVQTRLTFSDRLQKGFTTVRDIVGKVWVYVVLGIAVGAGIHGYVPADAMASLLGKDWWSVPLAVVVGVPLYANAAGIIPIVEALMAKGAALGTVLAFMMSVIALSLPELIILRKVLKPKLIATFVGVVSGGILLVGFVFNALGNL
jgi:uncharacterized membrane protein YraQ (UPF0718 family)